MRSGVASHWHCWIYGMWGSGPPRLVGDDLVAGPAQSPAKPDLLRLAGRRLEAPGEHAASVAHVPLGRRRGHREHLHLNLRRLARRDLILDHRLDRPVMTAAQRDLELALIGLGRRHQSGRAFEFARDHARDLDLLVGTEAEPPRPILPPDRHPAAANENAVAIA